MGFENWQGKPKLVREAAQDGNKDALAAMGRKGAQRAHENRERKADEAETLAMIAKERTLAEEEDRAHAANEHIIDPDGNDLDHHED